MSRLELFFSQALLFLLKYLIFVMNYELFCHLDCLIAFCQILCRIKILTVQINLFQFFWEIPATHSTANKAIRHKNSVFYVLVSLLFQLGINKIRESQGVVKTMSNLINLF